MPLKIIGDHPLHKDEHGRLKSRIATIFPSRYAMVTTAGIHAWQRLAFIDYLNQLRSVNGQPALSADQETAEFEKSVDLICEPECILIRPDPQNMPLAFEADEILQQLVSKAQIKFLNVRNERVQQAIKERGESWRIGPLPKSAREMERMVENSRMGIGGEPIYYYNRFTGTRFLTCHQFERLAEYPQAVMVQLLAEISEWSGKLNRQRNPEVAFFGVTHDFSHADFKDILWNQLDNGEVKNQYQLLASRFQSAVPAELKKDNPALPEWRNAMFKALVGLPNETLAEEILRGLSPEFFLQIEWLPGGRFEDGELLFDSIFDETGHPPEGDQHAVVCDPNVKGFFFHFIREYGELEYMNVGRVPSSLSKRERAVQTPKQPIQGRRALYIAEIQQRGVAQKVVRIIRLQKWGIHEHLDEGHDLLRSIFESEEYTEYILNRRLGCVQLGMNLPQKTSMGRIGEPYQGLNEKYRGQVFWVTFFERNYISGAATDKINLAKYQQPGYALRFAQLLGKAAAPNLVVGRLHQEPAGTKETGLKKIVFDDGDEIVLEGEDGLPQEIIVADYTGAFVDYETDLGSFAFEYASPVNHRIPFLTAPSAFAEAYVSAFLDRFCEIQRDYRKRRRAFDTLFKHCQYNKSGSFSFRWECVLNRLDHTDARSVAQKILNHIQLPNLHL